ncbi:hypothetical protein PRIPAC_93216 [Pristionchus pacificus]|uniref:PDZ domain-containing protein n=1 Tax=Pristionchus pacificus TaxID=54126 RepID=A0A2A6BB62_PRIPA|nr:hypothetical protein PRIPAC_93216 [Pristionchus pacificus]|eukprot:PDM63106.1 hypothetical protein PRIPAC_50321 [Pristionchus pacificus]
MTPRTVTITKGEDWKWGITFIGFCISTVTPGSSADLNGLRRGDELISTDGVRTDRNSKGLEIVTHVAEARGTITLGVRYNPKKLEEKERKKQEKLEADEKESKRIVLEIIAFIAAFVFALLVYVVLHWYSMI